MRRSASTPGGVAVDLSFQRFAEELAGLPGDYVAPHGTLLLGVVGGVPGGCVAVHQWQPGVCEMKRLYVRPQFQGTGCGRSLAERAISWTRDVGYRPWTPCTSVRLSVSRPASQLARIPG